MIAIHGQGFCASASEGFLLLLRNATRYFCGIQNIVWFIGFVLSSKSGSVGQSDRSVADNRKADGHLTCGGPFFLCFHK